MSSIIDNFKVQDIVYIKYDIDKYNKDKSDKGEGIGVIILVSRGEWIDVDFSNSINKRLYIRVIKEIRLATQEEKNKAYRAYNATEEARENFKMREFFDALYDCVELNLSRKLAIKYSIEDFTNIIKLSGQEEYLENFLISLSRKHRGDIRVG